MTPKHYTEEAHAHYLTFSCYQHAKLFMDEYLYSLFLQHLDRAHKRNLFKLFGFVVMPNHAHLLIHPEKNTSISTILKAIKQPFSHHALNYIKVCWPEIYRDLFVKKGERMIRVFWQAGGGYDRNIFSAAVFNHTMEYMHLNPVRKNLVTSPGDWKWSSAAFYDTGVADLIEIDVPLWL